MSDGQPTNTFLDSILKYWQIIAVVALGLMAYAQLDSRVSQLQKTTIEQGVALNTSSNNQSQIMVQLSQIQADLVWLKEKLK